ncbi:MAG: TerD family protein [Sporichthyaceae bacterium]
MVTEDAFVDAIADVIEDEPLDIDEVAEPSSYLGDAVPQAEEQGDAAPGDQLSRAMPDAAVAPRPGTVRGPRGVQTGKRRARPAPVPPLTLAGDKSWQAARLFSVSGTGSAQEQEKRATSALLATMIVVRDFGRGLVGRFGAPGGVIETYLEVPFVLGESTVYPDGVFRVARAGKVWTGLLEVKTGANPLRREQVENYLEVARLNGFDAVISLSNDLCSVGGDHPAAVDRRKLKKVALHHISWSEVLHEARMSLDHRGIEDREQAWVLAELIRYLQDPRSGAAGFDDMGGSWVPVREAIAAGTLRSTDKRVTEVAAAWDKLTRHMCLRLTGQLGVPVAPVLPRKVAGDAAARVQSAATQLAGDGRLSCTVRIPQAAGNLTVVAELRMGQVRTSIEVEAPREGGAGRRVNWMLRQLKDAPENLSVEVVVARQSQSTCELLRDVRVNNAALIPDPSADVRSFRLALPSPLGAKRSGLRGAFIPGVNAAVDSFYAQVVQSIRPWTKPAAKLPDDVAEEAEETIDALDEAAEDEAAPQHG